jgi:hypothetical protein
MSKMSTSSRRWRGPKQGIARGVAVFGSPGFEDPDRLKELLSHRNEVPRWATEHELELSDQPEGLSTLDSVLDNWNAEPEIGPKLANEVGLYLGNVIVENIEGAHWSVWPNGHPVIRLSSGHELDVTALVSQHLQGKEKSLSDLYLRALND